MNKTGFLSAGLAIMAMGLMPPSTARAQTILASETIPLATGPGSGAANLDMVVQTGANTFGSWGQRGATGLQGAASVFLPTPGGAYVNTPPSIVAMKFQLSSIVSALNTTYGAGNWTISNPTITMQYTFYANNAVFGGGAGKFDTYVVQNNNWSFSNGASGPGLFASYVAGVDAPYLPDAASLATWSNGQAYLGSTTYNWLSPTIEPAGQNAPINPNYNGWSTDMGGANQGILTDTLSTDPLLVNDILSGTANNNLSFYFIPDGTIGLTIFTGGTSNLPKLNFDVIAAPEPATLSMAAALTMALLVRRKRA
ncbi:MAG TPA: hypothetical protein VGN88_00865 [Phycisphaerae bacterium]